MITESGAPSSRLASRRSDERAVGVWFGLGLALKPVL
ncbi:MAG: hypothetical protein JWO88_3071, partial [Frankiales bacterium]|nr:hypothetical protein [Frankiales bacterium]